MSSSVVERQALPARVAGAVGVAAAPAPPRVAPAKKSGLLEEIAFGSVSVGVATLLTNPIDVLKVRRQRKKPVCAGTLDAAPPLPCPGASSAKCRGRRRPN